MHMIETQNGTCDYQYFPDYDGMDEDDVSLLRDLLMQAAEMLEDLFRALANKEGDCTNAEKFMNFLDSVDSAVQIDGFIKQYRGIQQAFACAGVNHQKANTEHDIVDIQIKIRDLENDTF